MIPSTPADRLAQLIDALPKPQPPFLVVGGMGLYLRQNTLQRDVNRSPLVPVSDWPIARTTEDIDLLLPVEILVQPESMSQISAALTRLGYDSIMDFLRFTLPEGQGPGKIDLLGGPITAEQRDQVKINGLRIRSRPAANPPLHARPTPEALASDQFPFVTEVRSVRTDGTPLVCRVQVPNPFTYLLMKLHAYRDAATSALPLKRQQAPKHAADLFRIVAMLDPAEFRQARQLQQEHQAAAPSRTARETVQQDFAREDHLGHLALIDQSQRTSHRFTPAHAARFRETLAAIFP